MVNYTAREVPYTRVIEHKHFTFGQQEKTVITGSTPPLAAGEEPYYPVNDGKNQALLARYQQLAQAGRRCALAAGWAATAITIWTRSSAPPWMTQGRSWPSGSEIKSFGQAFFKSLQGVGQRPTTLTL